VLVLRRRGRDAHPGGARRDPDPTLAAGLISDNLDELPGARFAPLRDLQLFVRFDPTLNGNGGGGTGNGGPDSGDLLRRDGHTLLVGSDPVTATQAANRDYAVPVYSALDADGFSPDQARGFQPTPQDFQFGVCATASSDPKCTVDPGTVPKAMDVITPAGTAQATELDYTAGPVVLQPVVIP
jgi:hypothetical protein